MKTHFTEKFMNSMKNMLWAVILISWCTTAVAQKSNEKEIIYSGQGKITLETGDEISGEVYHSRLTQMSVSVKTPDGETKRFKVPEVKGFTIGSILFEKVKTPKIAIKDADFAILLSNPESPIRVYEVCWQENVSMGAAAAANEWPTNIEYYVLFPVIGVLKDFSNIAFIPFGKKVSKLVEDCPELVAKIQNKEKGFFIGLISTDQDKQNVFVNIANAYANCKQ
jgi:hypothetical protein